MFLGFLHLYWWRTRINLDGCHTWSFYTKRRSAIALTKFTSTNWPARNLSITCSVTCETVINLRKIFIRIHNCLLIIYSAAHKENAKWHIGGLLFRIYKKPEPELWWLIFPLNVVIGFVKLVRLLSYTMPQTAVKKWTPIAYLLHDHN